MVGGDQTGGSDQTGGGGARTGGGKSALPTKMLIFLT